MTNRPPVTARLACCVPFCRRTCRNEKGWGEWLCPVHWRTVPPRLKSLRRRNKRKLASAMMRLDARGIEKAHNREGWLWGRCKAAAIERAALIL